jgi:hypothetical protein
VVHHHVDVAIVELLLVALTSAGRRVRSGDLHSACRLPGIVDQLDLGTERRVAPLAYALAPR